MVSAVTSGALSAVLKTAHVWVARRRGTSLSVRIGGGELRSQRSVHGRPATCDRGLACAPDGSGAEPWLTGALALIVASSRYTDATLTQLGAQAPRTRRRQGPGGSGDRRLRGDDVAQPAGPRGDAAGRGVLRWAAPRGSLVLLYFSGHGLLDERARLYFATTDTRVDRPRSTAVAADFVNDLMSECRSRRQVLVLDCCNSGAFARGVKAGTTVGTGERFEGRGRVVITASDALQYAFEDGHVEGAGIGSCSRLRCVRASRPAKRT